MKLLEGKTAIVTGASRGIGKGIATVFAQQGANVAFTYSSSSEAAEAIEKELSGLGVKVKAYKSNAADFEAAQQLATDVLNDFGQIDILVNNAGIGGPTIDEGETENAGNSFLSITDDAWDNHLQANLKTTFASSHAAIPHLSAGGSIIVGMCMH